MYLEISVGSSLAFTFMVVVMLTLQLLTLLDYNTEMIHHVLPHKILKFMLKSINNIERNYSSGRKEQMCFFSLCDCLHIKTSKLLQMCDR